MVKQLLNEINGLEGVEGVFIVTNRSEITNKTGTEYKDTQLKQLATHILRINAGYHLKGKKVTELEFYWQNRYVICKISDYFTLVTFCRTPRILSLLRITLNVTMSKLAEDKKFKRWLKSHIADTAFILRKTTIDAEEEKLLSQIS
jgi:hypothetical protein